jgi:hypothetical protein
VDLAVGARLLETLGRLGGWFRDAVLNICIVSAETFAAELAAFRMWLAAAVCGAIVTALVAHLGISRLPRAPG